MKRKKSIYKYLFTFAISVLSFINLAAKETTGMQSFYQLPDYPQCQIKNSLDNKIVNILKKYDIAGAELAVLKNNKVVFCKGYGFSNLKNKTSITKNTIVRVASISKMFTGTAVMQLYEQGKIKLDDDVSKYLGFNVKNPKFPETAITVGQLLSHTSSLSDSGSYDSILETNSVNGMKFAKLADISLKEMLSENAKYYDRKNFSEYKPGTHFEYSNFGIGILGSIVEKISGERFPEYCVKHIFKPLEMDASFDPGDIENYKNIGVLYRPDKESKTLKFVAQQDNYNGKKPPHTINNQPLGNALPYSPAGSVRTSVSDLTHFILMLLNNGKYNGREILKPETIKLMIESHWTGNEMDGFFKSYGYTVQQTEDFVKGVRFVGHAADAYGLIGDAYFIPAKKFAIIELFTGGKYGSSNPFFAVENEVSELLYDHFKN